MRNFLEFIRKQGVVGLAIGFILGGAAQDLVKALSGDIVSPTIGLATRNFGNLATASSTVSGQVFGWGHFIYEIINLILIAFFVYLVITRLHLDQLDKKEEKK